MWYELSPATEARALRWYAERNDETAARRRADPYPKPWDALDIERFERTARRLRAMAMLADVAECDRASQVDWLDMRNPGQSRDEEDAAVALAEAIYRWRTQA
jgi:hypothetical protein